MSLFDIIRSKIENFYSYRGWNIFNPEGFFVIEFLCNFTVILDVILLVIYIYRKRQYNKRKKIMELKEVIRDEDKANDSENGTEEENKKNNIEEESQDSKDSNNDEKTKDNNNNIINKKDEEPKKATLKNSNEDDEKEGEENEDEEEEEEVEKGKNISDEGEETK